MSIQRVVVETFLFILFFVTNIDAQDFWEETSGPAGVGSTYSIIAISNGTLFASTMGFNKPWSTFKSTNNGDTWIKPSDIGSSYTTCWHQLNNGYLFGGQGRIIRSTDYGIHWSSTSTQGAIYSISSSQFGILLASGGAWDVYGNYKGRIYRSTNNGDNWDQIQLVDTSVTTINSIVFNHSGYILFGSDEGIFISTDNGNTWSNILPSVPVRFILCDTNKIYCIAAGAIYKSTDNGNIWDIHSLPSEVSSLAINSGGNLFLGTSAHGVYRSTDEGINWLPFNSGMTANGIACITVNKNDYLYAGGLGTYVFRSTQPSTLMPPKLILPSDQDKNIAINPILKWDMVPSTSNYRLQVSRDSLFTNLILDQAGITQTLIQLSNLEYNTKYFWKVRALNQFFQSNWSLVWNFTTVLAAPTLSSPLNGTSSVSTSPVLNWNLSSGATSYRIQVSTTPSFSGLIVDDSAITINSHSISGLSNNTRYYWRVNAANADGISEWSLVWNFTTVGSPPLTPILISPDNASIGLSINQTLRWDIALGATSYRLQIATDTNFTTPIIDSSNITTTLLSVGNLSNDTKYYWRINAKNMIGTSDWSSIWNFKTIIAKPTTPYLIAPLDGAININPNVTLTWSASNRANSYQLQISTDSTFNLVELDLAGLIDTIYTAILFSNSTKYFWRVNANNDGGISGWSTVWNFTTNAAIPAAPLLISPLDGSIDIVTNPILNWNTSNGATSYRIQVATNTNFTNIIIDSSGILTTSLNISGILHGTKYYWRANSSNNSGTSVWSIIWNFTTSFLPPSTPLLISPSKNAINVLMNTPFIWNTVTNALSYRIQISKDSSFNLLEVDSSGILGASLTMSLLNDTKYFWRVNATNLGGMSNWSETWSFTTIMAAPNAPTLLSPQDGAVALNINPQLTWSTSVRATSYRLQISNNLNFVTTVFDTSGIIGMSLDVKGLENGTIYYWRVCAINIGGTSAWSVTWNFTTIPSIPNTPFLQSPIDSAFDISPDPLLTWYPTNGATSYRLQISPSTNFSTTILDQNGIVITFYSMNGLNYGTKYFWRVNASNSVGTSAWSATWSFTTRLQTAVKDFIQPDELILPKNFPNPFSESTTIRFYLQHEAYVALKIYNTIGQEMKTLISNDMSAGKHHIEWNANRFENGVYFYKLFVQSPRFEKGIVTTGKLVLIK